MKNRSKEAFKNIVNNYNWDIVNYEMNPDIAYNKFMKIFSAANGTVFPEIETKIKQKLFQING